jgi:hypothetical protein
MSIMDGGCGCKSCMALRTQSLHDARRKWKEGIREIIFKPWHYEYGDGCCSDWGTHVYINGFQAWIDGESVESVIEGLMEFLEIDNVQISYENED